MAFLLPFMEMGFNAAMIGGPLLAGGITAGIQATKGIDDACSNLETAKKNYNITKNKWGKVINTLNSDFEYTKNEAYELKDNFNKYKAQLKLTVDSFKNKQLMIDIFFAIFIFCLILTLLFKYFKVFENIKKLIL